MPPRSRPDVAYAFRAINPPSTGIMRRSESATKFQPMLRAAKGSLIIVSSTAAYHSTKGNPGYNASKTGAVGLTRTLGQAWAEDGIRVNGIAPGLVDTKMTKVTTSNPKRLEGAIGRIPLKRLGRRPTWRGPRCFWPRRLRLTSSVKPWWSMAASFSRNACGIQSLGTGTGFIGYPC